MSDVIRKVVTRQGTPEAETWWKRTTVNQSPKPLGFSLVQENVFSSEVEWRVRRMVYTIQRNTVSSTVARYHQRNGKQKDGCDLWDMHRTLRAKHDVCALSVSLSVHTTVSMCVCVCVLMTKCQTIILLQFPGLIPLNLRGGEKSGWLHRQSS